MVVAHQTILSQGGLSLFLLDDSYNCQIAIKLKLKPCRSIVSLCLYCEVKVKQSEVQSLLDKYHGAYSRIVFYCLLIDVFVPYLPLACNNVISTFGAPWVGVVTLQSHPDFTTGTAATLPCSNGPVSLFNVSSEFDGDIVMLETKQDTLHMTTLRR